ncbi:response regulator transcription factor [Fusibacter bizertensis]
MKKIMIIDESNEVANVIANILSQYMDFTLSGVHFTAVEALQHLKVENPEIIFINVLLSGMTGIKLTDKIKGYNPSTKVVLMSEDKRFRIDGYEAGADGFLLKPIKSEDVLYIMQSIYPDDIKH